MSDFTEIKPFTEEELVKLCKDYTFAVDYLACNVTFETYVGLVMLEQMIKE